MDREPLQTDYDDEVYAEGSYSGSSYAADYPNGQAQRASSLQERGFSYRTSAMVADTLNSMFENTEEYLNDLSPNYQFDLRPEYKLKVRKRTPIATVGVNYELNSERYEIVAKAGSKPDHPLWKVLSKVVVTPQAHDVRLFSTKAHWNILSLQCVYGHDWANNRSGLHWRLSTVWDLTPSSIGRKAVLPKVVPGLKTSVRWDVAVEKAPDMAGRVGFGLGGQAVDYDMGKFRISLPRMQASLKL